MANEATNTTWGPEIKHTPSDSVTNSIYDCMCRTPFSQPTFPFPNLLEAGARGVAKE
jgi:hypothetical protein